MANEPTPEELREARRQSLLQAHINGKRLTGAEKEEIEDLISEVETPKKAGKSKEETCKVEYLAKIFGVTARWIQNLTDEGTVPKIGRGEYPKDRALMAMAGHIKAQAGNVTSQMQVDKARQAKAEATTAEVDAALAIGSAVPALDFAAEWEDAVTRWRVVIETFPGLTELQREGLITKAAVVKLDGEGE